MTVDSINYYRSPYTVIAAANKEPGPLQSGVATGKTFESIDTAGKNEGMQRALKRLGIKECRTCRQRKYQDASNDPGVSFKLSAHLSPEQAASALAAHEGEHVANERDRAEKEGREVVFQNVRIYMSVCPECGRVYVSGGKTATVTVGNKIRKEDTGNFIDQYA